MLSQDTLKQRVEDALTRRWEGAGAGKSLHINFVLSELDDYAVLITGGRKCVLFVAEKGEDHIARLRSDIAANELGDKFDVEPMPQA